MLNDIIGGGNMGEAIIKGLIAAHLVKPQQITVTDIVEARLIYLRDTYGVRAMTDNAKAVAPADLIILAVKPQDIVPTIQGIAAAVDDHQVVISIAAGVPTAKIEAAFGQPVRVVRVMPNTPALVLAGAAGCVLAAMPRRQTWRLPAASSTPWGRRSWCLSTLMDAVTGLSGSGPAYIFRADRGTGRRWCEDGTAARGSADLGRADRVRFGQTPAGDRPASRRVEGSRDVTGRHDHCRTACFGRACVSRGVMDAVERATLRSRELGQ